MDDLIIPDIMLNAGNNIQFINNHQNTCIKTDCFIPRRIEKYFYNFDNERLMSY
jgi:hypothetical protein